MAPSDASFESAPSTNTRVFTFAVMTMGALTWFAIVLFFKHVGFSVYREDLQHYIEWSYHLSQHTDYASHMPAWPALIWFARHITFEVVPDTVLAQVLALLAWAISVALAASILNKTAYPAIKPGLILFAFFPMIGVATVANPFCDILAYAVALCAFWLALDRRWALVTFTIAAGLLVHQAFYPFYLALAIVCVVKYRMPLLYLLLSGIPFVLYYLHVAVQKHDLNWIAHFHEAVHTAGPGRFPFFDGIIRTAFRLSPKYELKGAILVAACLAAFGLTAYCIQKRHWLLLSLCLPSLLASILSPEDVSFVIVRLSKFLVLPACSWLVGHPRLLRFTNKVALLSTALTLLIASQLIWAYYGLFFYGFM
jgi:hypothetical protein